MNKRLENKITRWYGSSRATRFWIAKYWWKFINGRFGPAAELECDRFPIDEPKGFAEMAEYCYNTYWRIT